MNVLEWRWHLIENRENHNLCRYCVSIWSGPRAYYNLQQIFSVYGSGGILYILNPWIDTNFIGKNMGLQYVDKFSHFNSFTHSITVDMPTWHHGIHPMSMKWICFFCQSGHRKCCLSQTRKVCGLFPNSVALRLVEFRWCNLENPDFDGEFYELVFIQIHLWCKKCDGTKSNNI